MDRRTRNLLGAAALVLAITGVAWVVTQDDTVNGEVALRVAAILGSVWLVAPMIRRPGLGAALAAIGGLVVIVRPRLVVAVVVAAVIWRLSRESNDR